jgi:zinc protease
VETRLAFAEFISLISSFSCRTLAIQKIESMRRIILLLMLMVVAISNIEAQSTRILPFPIQQKKLANGLNVVTVPFNSPGLASLYIVVRAGSREEVEEGKTGFAHFFEHIMFRGTDKYSKEAYDEVLKTIGASANANTSLDRTVYYMTGNAGMLEKNV